MLNNLNEMIEFFQDSKEFNAAVDYTAGYYGFSAILIEKDYLATLVLQCLNNFAQPNLVFKGGTLLSKAYANFKRMSEDLDFSISMERNVSRSKRSKTIAPIKNILNNIRNYLPMFYVEEVLIGHNDSTQYCGKLGYHSNLIPSNNAILIDINMREPLYNKLEKTPCKTLLADPFTSQSKCQPIMISSLTKNEAYAEKIRAAFSRKELAIRDFYDLDHAIETKQINLQNKELIALLNKKLQYEEHIHDFTTSDVTEYLQAKIHSELNPTLRYSDIGLFDLKRVINNLQKLLEKITLSSLTVTY